MRTNKQLLSIVCVTACILLFTGCGINAGVKSRKDVNGLDKLNKWSHNWTDELHDWADDVGSSLNNSGDNDSSKLYEENINKNIDGSGINELQLSTYASNVTITTSDTSEFKISCQGTSNIVTDTTIEVQNDSLIVKENKKSNSVNIGLKDVAITRTVTVAIPDSFAGDIYMSGGAGTTEMNNFTCNNIKIDGGAGELNINDIVFKDLKLSQGVGSTTVNLIRPSGNMHFDGGVGNLTVSLKSVSGNLSYSGGVGTAVINIPDNSPVKIKTDSGVGECQINVKTSGEDKYHFDLETGVGNLTINSIK